MCSSDLPKFRTTTESTALGTAGLRRGVLARGLGALVVGRVCVVRVCYRGTGEHRGLTNGLKTRKTD